MLKVKWSRNDPTIYTYPIVGLSDRADDDTVITLAVDENTAIKLSASDDVIVGSDPGPVSGAKRPCIPFSPPRPGGSSARTQADGSRLRLKGGDEMWQQSNPPGPGPPFFAPAAPGPPHGAPFDAPTTSAAPPTGANVAAATAARDAAAATHGPLKSCHSAPSGLVLRQAVRTIAPGGDVVVSISNGSISIAGRNGEPVTLDVAGMIALYDQKSGIDYLIINSPDGRPYTWNNEDRYVLVLVLNRYELLVGLEVETPVPSHPLPAAGILDLAKQNLNLPHEVIEMIVAPPISLIDGLVFVSAEWGKAVVVEGTSSDPPTDTVKVWTTPCARLEGDFVVLQPEQPAYGSQDPGHVGHLDEYRGEEHYLETLESTDASLLHARNDILSRLSRAPLPPSDRATVQRRCAISGSVHQVHFGGLR